MKSKIKSIDELRNDLFVELLVTKAIKRLSVSAEIATEYEEYLKCICSKYKLSSIKGDNPLIQDISIALYSDFNKNTFINVNNSNMMSLIEKILPDLYFIDLEDIMLDVFNRVMEYNEKHSENRYDDDPDEDDEEIYEFILKYDEIAKLYDWNFESIALQLHEMKASTINNILNNYELKVSTNNNYMIFNYDHLPIKAINEIYVNEYCEKALANYSKT